MMLVSSQQPRMLARTESRPNQMLTLVRVRLVWLGGSALRVFFTLYQLAAIRVAAEIWLESRRFRYSV